MSRRKRARCCGRGERTPQPTLERRLHDRGGPALTAETPHMLLVFVGAGAQGPIRPLHVAAVLSSITLTLPPGPATPSD